jgi:uncharacterized protein (DUF2225 family)
MSEFEITPDGYQVVYISEWFFQTLETEMSKIARYSGSTTSKLKMMSLRDEPAKVEFRRLEEKL